MCGVGIAQTHNTCQRHTPPTRRASPSAGGHRLTNNSPSNFGVTTKTNQFLGNLASVKPDRAKTSARLALELEQGVHNLTQYFPIFDRASQEHIGAVGLRPKGEPEAKCYELGVHLRVAYWGKGLAAEAATSVVDFGFHVLGAASIFGGHFPDNHRSAKLLTKLGFVYTHDEVYDGLPDVCYSLPKDAWMRCRGKMMTW